MDKKQSLYDMQISPLGYGCYALSGAYGTKLKEHEMIKILQYAYELGIKFYDTAGSYIGTEEILGRAIKPFRHDIVISSKVGITENNKINLSKEFIRFSCESSLIKLKTDYIGIYQLIPYNDGVYAYIKLEKDKSSGNKSLDKLNEIRNEIKSILY